MEIEGITPEPPLRTHGQGTVAVEFKVNKKVYTVKLNNVKHAPDALNNLISNLPMRLFLQFQ